MDGNGVYPATGKALTISAGGLYFDFYFILVVQLYRCKRYSLVIERGHESHTIFYFAFVVWVDGTIQSALLRGITDDQVRVGGHAKIQGSKHQQQNKRKTDRQLHKALTLLQFPAFFLLSVCLDFSGSHDEIISLSR